MTNKSAIDTVICLLLAVWIDCIINQSEMLTIFGFGVAEKVNILRSLKISTKYWSRLAQLVDVCLLQNFEYSLKLIFINYLQSII